MIIERGSSIIEIEVNGNLLLGNLLKQKLKGEKHESKT